MSCFEFNQRGMSRETLEAVREQLRQRAAAMCHDSERARQILGQANRAGAKAIDGVGALRSRMTPFDRVALKVMQNADVQRDPDAEKWFLKQPEGEYARVQSKGTKEIQVGYAAGSKERGAGSKTLTPGPLPSDGRGSDSRGGAETRSKTGRWRKVYK